MTRWYEEGLAVPLDLQAETSAPLNLQEVFLSVTGVRLVYLRSRWSGLWLFPKLLGGSMSGVRPGTRQVRVVTERLSSLDERDGVQWSRVDVRSGEWRLLGRVTRGRSSSHPPVGQDVTRTLPRLLPPPP